jgi:hypothetical protein
MKIRIASVRKFSIVASTMRTFIVAIIFLAIAVSVRAQGQIVVSGSEILTAVPVGQNFDNQATVSYMIMAPPIPTLSPSGPSSEMGSASQISSLDIQAVPEPNSFALIIVGVLTGVSIFRRSRIRSITLN